MFPVKEHFFMPSKRCACDLLIYSSTNLLASPKTHSARVVSGAACVGGAHEDDARFVGEPFGGGATGAMEPFRLAGRTRHQDLRVRGDRFDVVRDLVGGRGDVVDDEIGHRVVDDAGYI